MKVAVIGMGYVGFPLALQIASKQISVLGFDISKDKIAKLKAGVPIIKDEFISKHFPSKYLSPSNVLEPSDIYIICVPTPVDERNIPDLTPVASATESIAKVLEDGQLVILESTVYPGTCEEVMKPILDKTGKKYLLAHCPERINPLDKDWDTHNTPRVVGGYDVQSMKVAADFYRKILDAKVYELETLKEAEATKILENTFRDVNIALVNEMAQSFYRMGIDIKNVIGAASTKPFGYMPFYPGIGVGGHCIAVDPYYMIEKGREAGFDHEYLKLARKINSNMPIYAAYLMQNMLNEIGLPLKGTKIGVYGLAYKPNIADDRESPSHQVIKRLAEKKAAVIAFDPYVPAKSGAKDLDDFLSKCDVLLVATAHDQIVNMDYSLLSKYNIKAVLDGRNCLDKKKIKSMGILYRGIGRQ